MALCDRQRAPTRMYELEEREDRSNSVTPQPPSRPAIIGTAIVATKGPKLMALRRDIGSPDPGLPQPSLTWLSTEFIQWPCANSAPVRSVAWPTAVPTPAPSEATDGEESGRRRGSS